MKIKEIDEFINTLKVGGPYKELKKDGELVIDIDYKIYHNIKYKYNKEKHKGKIEFFTKKNIIYIKRLKKI